MSDCVAGTKGRAFRRLALAGLGLLLVVGMFVRRHALHPKRQSVHQSFREQYAPRAASSSGVTSSPLAQAAPGASATHTASLSRPQAVGGSAAGWTAAGGSPIVVANGETLDTVSGRYGVPASALLAANGLSSASEVKSGTHLVVPSITPTAAPVASTEKAERNTTRTSPTPTSAKSAKKAKDKEKEKTAKADKAAKEAEKSASKDAKSPRAPRSPRPSRPSRRR